MKVTLYAICKNEEKNIENFIETSKKFSHTVVVDTGSTDNTVQLLKESGIEVHEHPQTREDFDFALARNQALSYVETDWAFSLDFNEELDDFYLEGIELISNELTCYKHQRFDNENENITESNEIHVRFHRTKNYEWKNAVHEVPVFILTEGFPEEKTVDTHIKITKKINRSIDKQLFYISICEREYQKDPKNWYYIWFIFNHYYMVKNLQRALEFGQEFLNNSKPYFHEFRIECFIKCSQILFQLNDIHRGANYSFHALSEAMNLGEPHLSKAFSHLIEVSTVLNDPNITIFATAFNPNTKLLPERNQSIEKLFLTNLDDVPATAWTGHRGFANWLVNYLKPKVIVDLGTDWGFSAFCFAMPRIGKVYTIDNYFGDSFVGEHDGKEKYKFLLNKRKKLFLDDNLEFIKGDFTETSKVWDKKIDILHIDGDHLYESVKNDFETWSQFLNDGGVILMHDTCVEEYNNNNMYGVKKFFEEIDLPKVNFTHTFGLGIISKNKQLIDLIQNNFNLSQPL
jgi:predicted O-methyltransferase YrrM